MRGSRRFGTSSGQVGAEETGGTPPPAPPSGFGKIEKVGCVGVQARCLIRTMLFVA